MFQTIEDIIEHYTKKEHEERRILKVRELIQKLLDMPLNVNVYHETTKTSSTSHEVREVKKVQLVPSDSDEEGFAVIIEYGRRPKMPKQEEIK
ncbi:hypothetical protein [Paenibacillus sp. 1P03SA]|uniref:hypothetical protein n=1 Tax=Paenibacillus sp. 1P03SA TaxID=3132294 RepID=UPI00399FC075